MSMKAACVAVLGVACLAMWLAADVPQHATGWVHEYPTPMTREEAAVTVNGVEEIWALRWKLAPKPECEVYEFAITCPCHGFEYGEAGDLELVRMRGRIVFDRLALSTFFEEGFSSDKAVAILPRWSMTDDDSDDTIKERRLVRVMDFADYDHDGRESEFYLTSETISCGHTYGMVVGVSKTNPRLHVFGTASHPDKPLYLQEDEWEALRKATGPVEMVDWQCEDHGAQEETVVNLFWTESGIDGRRRNYACGPGGRGKLISEEPL